MNSWIKTNDFRKAIGETFLYRRKVLRYSRKSLSSVVGISERVIEHLETSDRVINATVIIVIGLELWPSLDMMLDDIHRTHSILPKED